MDPDHSSTSKGSGSTPKFSQNDGSKPTQDDHTSESPLRGSSQSVAALSCKVEDHSTADQIGAEERVGVNEVRSHLVSSVKPPEVGASLARWLTRAALQQGQKFKGKSLQRILL